MSAAPATLTGLLTFQPSKNWLSQFNWTYTDFTKESTSEKEFDIQIYRMKNTFQFNKYLFVRGIFEYKTQNSNIDNKKITTDALGSFTYIPGTVIHFGYGSIYKNEHYKYNQNSGCNEHYFHKKLVFP